jgi:hypothetical protein
VQSPEAESQVWFAGQAEATLQSFFGWQLLVAGLQTSLSLHSAPPHLHLPSATSQLVPAWHDTPVHSVDTQVFAVGSQAKPEGQTTPPRPPHLHWPSSGSHRSGDSQLTFCREQTSVPPLHATIIVAVTEAAAATQRIVLIVLSSCIPACF